MTLPRLRAAVVAGSTRPNRQARTVAEWVCAEPDPDLELVLVDLAEIDLPFLAEPTPAAFGDYQLPSTRRWSELVDSFDAFVLVSPEYNHSTSAALKNALDHLYVEWRDKPVAFVGYGIEGGQRAVEHLRLVTAELGMPGVRSQASLSLMTDYHDGHLDPAPFQTERRKRMLSELTRWAEVFYPLRHPSGADEAKSDAIEAVEHFVAGIQAGLDSSDADLYDRHFADDLLWGSPYGKTLNGFDSVNSAHRRLMDQRSAPRSRYEIVQVLMPVPGTVIAQVRRRALSVDEAGAFSEMAMYVLVERFEKWELVAGQNTPIATSPS